MMKYVISVLLCAALVCGAAFALIGEGYPAFNGTDSVVNAIGGSIASQELLLPFDPTPEHSYVANGYIQACFYSYDAKEENYAELYLFLPDTIKAGDVLTDRDAGAEYTCVGLYEVFPDGSETECLAGQMSGMTYPVGSGYEIRIESVEMNGSTAAIRGKVTAQLVSTDSTRAETAAIDAEFNFSMDMNQTPTTQDPAPGNSGSAAPASDKAPVCVKI